MSQFPPRRRATRVHSFAILAALAAPFATPAQPSVGNTFAQSPIVEHPLAAPAAARPRADRAVSRAANMDTLSFAHAALVGRRIELVPALERMGSTSDDQVVAQPMLVGVTAELRHVRRGASVLQLLDRTASSLDAMCTDAAGQRRRSCRSMAIQLTAARAHLRAGRKVEARRALASLAKHADEAVQSRTFEPWEGTVIGETARYAVERV
jgi:hypothetical protein